MIQELTILDIKKPSEALPMVGVHKYAPVFVGLFMKVNTRIETIKRAIWSFEEQ